MMVTDTLAGQLKTSGGSRAVRTTACFVLCALVVALYAPRIASGLRGPIELAIYALDGHMSPWLVGAMAAMYGAARRSQVWAEMRRATGPSYAVSGAALVLASWLLPSYAAPVVAVFGTFRIFFGPASMLLLPAMSL